tara:strand:- start:3806 stop:3991 length:186 start_codon:yes stop_codon:yes gene_type:complete
MQFEKKTRIGNSKGIFGILIKIILTLVVLSITIILIDRIDFPSPIKKIEKVIPNENFKIVK